MNNVYIEKYVLFLNDMMNNDYIERHILFLNDMMNNDYIERTHIVPKLYDE